MIEVKEEAREVKEEEREVKEEECEVQNEKEELDVKKDEEIQKSDSEIPRKIIGLEVISDRRFKLQMISKKFDYCSLRQNIPGSKLKQANRNTNIYQPAFNPRTGKYNKRC